MLGKKVLIAQNNTVRVDVYKRQTFRFYAEQTYDECIARVIVPKDVKRGKVYGDVFEINYREQAANVARNSVEPDHDRLTFADGYVLVAPCRSSFDAAMALVGEHGGVKTHQTLPKDADALVEGILISLIYIQRCQPSPVEMPIAMQVW